MASVIVHAARRRVWGRSENRESVLFRPRVRGYICCRCKEQEGQGSRAADQQASVSREAIEHSAARYFHPQAPNDAAAAPSEKNRRTVFATAPHPPPGGVNLRTGGLPRWPCTHIKCPKGHAGADVLPESDSAHFTHLISEKDGLPWS